MIIWPIIIGWYTFALFVVKYYFHPTKFFANFPDEHVMVVLIKTSAWLWSPVIAIFCVIYFIMDGFFGDDDDNDFYHRKRK